MCHLVREHHPASVEQGHPGLPPDTIRLQPRWVGAAAATLIGGLALAAILNPPEMLPPPHAREAAAPAAVTTLAVPVAAATAATAATVDGSGARLVDDGVPGAAEVAGAGVGHCHHGL